VFDSAFEHRFGHKIGSPDGQATWEALAVLMGLMAYGPLCQQAQLGLRVRGDNMAALCLMQKLCSGTKVLNAIGAHVSLYADKHELSEVLTEHIPGVWNVEADALSRLSRGASFPKVLLHSKQRTPPKLDDSTLPLWGVAMGTAKGPIWAQASASRP